MIYSLYSVYDEKIMSYGPVICMDNEVNAIRAFSSVANDKSSDIGRFPDDFRLYQVGTFDSEAGVIDRFPIPVLVASASKFVRSSENAS